MMTTSKCLRLTVFYLALAIASPAQGRLPFGKTQCGTVISERQIQVEIERSARDFYRSFTPQVNRPYWIPMAIHIVRRTDGSGGLTLAELRISMEDLNRLWLGTGLQFYQHGNIDYINSDYYYTVPDSPARRNELRQVNPVANTINAYFTDELVGFCGHSTFSSDPVQGVLLDNQCVGLWNQSTFAHEIGHYFDLYHTHETAFGVECPSGSNCSQGGDLICDTSADPGLNFSNVNSSCVWTGTASPPASCDMTPYNPPTHNIMSYSRGFCCNQFTTGQNTKAMSTLTGLGAPRAALRDGISRYVASDGSLTSACTYANPCRTLFRAAQEIANPGDTIFMLSGSYPVAFITRAVWVKKWNTDAGVVIIGQLIP